LNRFLILFINLKEKIIFVYNMIDSNEKNIVRLNIIFSILYIIILIFLMKIINIQLIKFPYYRELAERNRTQIINQSAPRGRIITSDNIVVASNKPTFSLVYFPNYEKDSRELKKLAHFISEYTSENEQKIYLNLLKSLSVMKPVKLAENLSAKSIMNLSELKNFYQGIELVTEASRYYPYNTMLSHILGYMGKIDQEDWKLYAGNLEYSMDAVVGKTGIEKRYEKYLKGKDGGLYMEVDNKGRLIRIMDTKQGISGKDLYLTINFKVQEAAEKALNLLVYKKGCAIAIEPFTGRILAYAIKPGFDLNFFSDYSENKRKEKFEFDEFNIGIQGTYAPASTFKIISTIDALESGKISPEEIFYCPGFYNAGDRVFKCWEKKGHKRVDMLKGLANSCDVYYYNVAYKIGPLEIENIAKLFGIGSKTGIDLPGEKAGNLFGPSIRASKKSYWFIGDTLNLAIGQGETLVTPIQLAVLMASIATRGKVYRPYYLEKIVSNKEDEVILRKEPELLKKIELKPQTWDFVYKALKEVVESGTGQMAKMKNIEVYGKTGTAQNPHGKDHAWFIAFASLPGEKPGIAVCVLVEHGEHGSSAGAPVAREIIRAFYGNKISEVKDENLSENISIIE